MAGKTHAADAAKGCSVSAQLYGVDMFGASMAPKPSGPVAEKFLFPPFTVLDALADYFVHGCAPMPARYAVSSGRTPE